MEPLRVSSSDAWGLICEPWLPRGWGVRHLFVGYSGSGKSVALDQLCQYLKKQYVMTVAVDQKPGSRRYDAVQVAGVEGLKDVGSRSCVVRGSAFRNDMEARADFDALSRAIWAIGGAGIRVGLVIDELSDAQRSEKRFAAPKGQMPWLEVLYRQGREAGISVVAATQLPQEIPRSAYSLSDSVGFFLQEGHEADYYRRLGILSSTDVDTVANLQQYMFLLWRRGDRQRYFCRVTL